MPLILTAAGVAVVLVATIDALVTTVGASAGAGPVTARLVQGGWWMLGRPARSFPGLRAAGGSLLVLVTVASWIVLLWVGWSLVFLGGDEAVVASATQEVAGAGARVYYAGYTLFTLGNGGYQPNGLPWELLTAAAALNGLFLVTLSITYLLPVVTAATERRQQAATIAGIGMTPDQIVATGWDGRSFAYLEDRLPVIASGVTLTSIRHLSYPVLQHFGSQQPSRDFPARVVALALAVDLLHDGVASDIRPRAAVLQSVDSAIDELMTVLEVDARGESTPPPPELLALRAHGMPTVGDDEWSRAADASAERRRRLRNYLSRAGLTWEDAVAPHSVAAGE